MTNTEQTEKTEKKSSAFYQRQYRQRLREQGLVKKEVWVLPDHNKTLLVIEKVLRQHHDDMTHVLAEALKHNDAHKTVKPKKNISKKSAHISVEQQSTTDHHWHTKTLFNALQQADFFVENHASIELIEGIYATIYINMHDFGDLPIFINVTGEQILVESLLFEVADIADKNAFNTVVLRTHKYFPLSTISLDKIGDDGEYYQMFGSLSSTSDLKEVLIEIELLAHNVLQATEAYSAFFKE